MQRLESGSAGGVIVYDMSRFSRRPIEGERLIESAERGLTVLDSESEYDLGSGPMARNSSVTCSAPPRTTRTTCTRKVKRGKRVKAMNGESNATSAGLFGYELDGGTVRGGRGRRCCAEFVARLLAGDSQDAMIKDLNRPVGSRRAAGGARGPAPVYGRC